MTDQNTISRSKYGPIRVRSGQDFAAGLFLIGVGLFAFWSARDLSAGTLNAMGDGMLPQALAVLVSFGGICLVLNSLLHDGGHLERWALRGGFFIFGSIVLFALSIRTFGLIITGPVAIIFASMASEEFQWKETGIFAVILTAVCIVIFNVILRLPIPAVGTLLHPFLPSF
jgi:putative tricarboxylic transport membrane protein